jgi:hypothetical protein
MEDYENHAEFAVPDGGFYEDSTTRRPAVNGYEASEMRPMLL